MGLVVSDFVIFVLLLNIFDVYIKKFVLFFKTNKCVLNFKKIIFHKCSLFFRNVFQMSDHASQDDSAIIQGENLNCYLFINF